MATILLQTAGAFLGGVLGPVGSAIGSAAGAMLGYSLDRALIGSFQHDFGPRLSGTRPFAAEDGAVLPRVYGTMRVTGTLIWATRFEENSTTERRGAKGGPRSTTYSYFANVAFALCEGQIAGVRRVWADGSELDLEDIEFRTYRGSDEQPVDPLIQAKQGEGNAPAYRGTAYVVLERLPLERFGNRIPQFHFEVMRPVGGMGPDVRAVALLPGSTEYGLLPTPAAREMSPGEWRSENRHVTYGPTDFVASLDELQALCPNLENIGLVVTWFGDDLRAGQCRIAPKVIFAEGSYSRGWSAGGVERSDAQEVSRVDGAPAYGGTPSDESVIEAIREIGRRGLKVTLYPFVMMDVAAGNSREDPYTGESSQPVYPWRGRITCHPAPGTIGTADKTSVGRSQVEAFCGAASASDFTHAGDGVNYAGDQEDWGYRRLILHYAALAAEAGGVDAFLIGSELRGLNAIRDQTDAFPFVEQLCDLAGEVRSLVGPNTLISYGADWTEYFGHQPGDGTGDAYFHLDPLWAHPDIDAVGIDNYMPLSDWRDEDFEGGNPDGFAGPYGVDALRSQIASGEGYDWYYANEEHRRQRVRTPIDDGAHGKPWVFRYKDIHAWWANSHFDRPGGSEAAVPTAWMPRSKPIWFTELGCPAVDKGPNQPNVFPDPKSSENALPYFSSGARSDTAQNNFLAAHFHHWTAVDGANPPSDIYDGSMVDPARIYCWAWDARPFPAFPTRIDTWNDGGNWLCGHWLNGRLGSVELEDFLRAVFADHGLAAPQLLDVVGTLAGFLIEEPGSARQAIERLATLFGLVASARGDTLAISGMSATEALSIEADLVTREGMPDLARTRTPDHELPTEAILAFADPLRSYQASTAMVTRQGSQHRVQETISISGAIDGGQAHALLESMTRRRWLAREEIGFALPAQRTDVVPGVTVRLDIDSRQNEYIVTQEETGIERRLTARRTDRSAQARWVPVLPSLPPPPSLPAGAPLVVALDLPMAPGTRDAEDQFRLAVRAKPWRTQAVFASSEATGFERRATFTRSATIGLLETTLLPGFEGRRDFGSSIKVRLLDGALENVTSGQFLAGANIAAVEAGNGGWEILRFQRAEEIEPALWQLSTLLRGEAGSQAAMLSGAPVGNRFVLLDDAVMPAGLRLTEAGMTLNWRIGPIGADVAGPLSAAITTIGGERAQRALAPVHLRADYFAEGGILVKWMRRSRRYGTQSITATLPLDEPDEAYLLSVSSADGGIVRQIQTAEPRWHYPPALLATDFPVRPTLIMIEVAQIGGASGPGDGTILHHRLN